MFDKVVVLGATGFLGRHTVPILQTRYGRDQVVPLSSKDYDLLDRAQVRRMFEEIKPDAVVHLAAYSGGIGVNRIKPADFYFINITMQSLVFEEAARYGRLKKMFYPVAGCAYPAHATSPIDEGQIWQGYPQPESAGYSCAKKMGLVASESYRAQYGLNTSVIISNNMYGEHDNFRNDESHVIPALIRRYHEQIMANAKQITMWGTGAPLRDFVYAGDVAAVIPYFLEEYDSTEPVNISPGKSISIRELAETLKSAMGFDGELIWDTSKPDGQALRIFDVSRMRSLGLDCTTPLADGLAKTVAWFKANYSGATDGLRL